MEYEPQNEMGGEQPFGDCDWWTQTDAALDIIETKGETIKAYAKDARIVMGRSLYNFDNALVNILEAAEGIIEELSDYREHIAHAREWNAEVAESIAAQDTEGR